MIQAFQIRTQADMNLAIQSCADYILLDQGKEQDKLWIGRC